MQIKLLKYEQQNNTTTVTIYNENDSTKTTVVVYGTERDKQEILKDALILSKFTNKEKYEDEEVIENVEMAEPRPSKMYADFANLSGYVIDQYADKMENEIKYSIEGKGATIQGNKIVEEEVEEDTSYFIVAKCGELVEKQERFLYAPVPKMEDPIIKISKDLETLTEAINLFATYKEEK